MNLEPIFADCCSEINIVLADEVLQNQDSKQGEYKIEDDLVNARNHWTSLDGNQALWYDSLVNNKWMIGKSSNRGSSTAGIFSAYDSVCPNQNKMKHKYWNGSSWLLAPKNSISITCS